MRRTAGSRSRSSSRTCSAPPSGTCASRDGPPGALDRDRAVPQDAREPRARPRLPTGSRRPSTLTRRRTPRRLTQTPATRRAAPHARPRLRDGGRPGAPARGRRPARALRYHFCSTRCRARFEADPLQFIAIDPVCGMEVNPHAAEGRPARARRAGATTSATRSASPGSPPIRGHLAHGPGGSRRPPPPSRRRAARWSGSARWIPEVREQKPVPCPICGMALEPLVVGGMPSAEEPPNPELANMSRRFWLGLAPAAAVLALAMGDMLLGDPLRHRLGFRGFALLQLALATPVVLWGGWPFFERAWLSVRTWKLNMFTLIGLGTGGRLRLQRRRDRSSRPSAFPRGVPRARRAARLLRGGGGDRRARAARAGAGAPRAQPRVAAPSARSCGLAPRTARRARPGRRRARRRRRQVARRRPAPRAPRREGAGGRRRRRRALPRWTSRWSPASRSRWRSGRRPRHRRRRSTRRARFVMRAERVGQGHPPRADRPDGHGRAAEPRADPAARRPRGGLVRAGRRARPPPSRSPRGPPRPRAAARARPRRRRRGADHRLPLRARPRDADGDHGRDRAAAPPRACS